MQLLDRMREIVGKPKLMEIFVTNQGRKERKGKQKIYILERAVEIVSNDLQQGPLGIIEHEFSAAEVNKAKATAERAVANWRSYAELEKNGHVGSTGRRHYLGHKKVLPMDFGKCKLIKLEEEEEMVLVKNLFYMSAAYLGRYCQVREIHRHEQLKDSREACLEALLIFANNIQGKCNNLGVTYAWHGTSKVVLSEILDNNSDSKKEYTDNGTCRILYLYQDTEHCAVDSIVSSTPDECGLINVLFCRIIGQDLSQKFLPWNPHIDKHVQPLYVLTIGLVYEIEILLMNPVPITPMPDVLAALSELLPLEMMNLIRKKFVSYMELRIDWERMLEWMKDIVGTPKLQEIIAAIKNKKKEKQMQGSSQKRDMIGTSKGKEIEGSWYARGD